MNSRKVYVPGKMYPDIRVGMREILTEDPETPVVTVYDTSGPNPGLWNVVTPSSSTT